MSRRLKETADRLRAFVVSSDETQAVEDEDDIPDVSLRVVPHTGGKGTLTQWVHCEFVVSFEAICPVVTQQVCGEFF